MRKLGFSLFFLILTLPVAAHAGTISSPVHNNGLVGYWSFDIGEDGTTAYDMSGQGNHGTLTNMDHASDWIDGQIDSALDFDGSNDHFTLEGTQFPDLGNNLTVAVWVKPSANGDFAIFGQENAADAFHLRTNVTSVTGSDVEAYIPGTPIAATSAVGLVSPNTWTHITYTRSGTGAGTHTIYVNGQPRALGTDSSSNYSDTTVTKYIGQRGNGTEYFAGTMDDLRIYDRALSPADVERLYRIGSPTVNRKRNIVTNGLVGHWTFDGNDTSATQTYDSSGQENHGALNGGLSGMAGKLGQALKFGGTDGYVTVNDASELDFSDGSTISIAAWVRPDDFGGFYEYVLKGRVADNLNANYAFRQNSERKLQFYYYGTETPTYQIWTTDAAQLSTSTWTHVVAEYTLGTGSSMKMYVNGQQVSGSWTQGSGNETPPLNNEALVFGSKQFDAGGGGGDPDTYYHGTLDDLRIYNRALSADEIGALYTFGAPSRVNAGVSGGPQSGLVAHWTFDGNDTDTVGAYDMSGQNRHATLNNSPLKIAGRFGQALQFDGVNSYTRASGFSDLGTSNQPYSFSGWVKVSPGETQGDIIHMSLNSTGSNGWCLPPVSLASTGVLRANSWNGSLQSVSAATQINPGVWYHFANTWDPSGLKIYVNGVLEGTTAQATYTASGGSNYVFLGIAPSNCAGFTDDFAGIVDDVRIYNHALSADEIKQLYNLGR